MTLMRAALRTRAARRYAEALARIRAQLRHTSERAVPCAAAPGDMAVIAPRDTAEI